jgi:hypothetical protein
MKLSKKIVARNGGMALTLGQELEQELTILVQGCAMARTTESKTL